MTLTRRRKLALGSIGGVLAATAIASRALKGPSVDPCGPDGLAMPSGTRTTITADDGAALSVFTAGSEHGPVVVLAHCWMGGMALWGAVARRLVASGHRVVLWDQRGHGDSTLGTDPITVDRLGEDLHQVLQGVDVSGVVLAGHSMGGMTVQAFATHHPDELVDRVRGVVLAATAPHSGRVKVSPRVATAMLGDRRTALLAKRQPGSLGPYAHVDSVRATHDAMLETAGVARAGFLVAMGRMDFRPSLANITVPTKIFVGSRDWLTPPSRARNLLAGIPDAELHVLAGYGHMLPFEAPDVLSEAITSLAARPGAT